MSTLHLGGTGLDSTAVATLLHAYSGRDLDGREIGNIPKGSQAGTDNSLRYNLVEFKPATMLPDTSHILRSRENSITERYKVSSSGAAAVLGLSSL